MAREEAFPAIVVKGELKGLQDFTQVAIIAEKQVLCKVNGGLVDAAIGLMAAYYVFMFKYAGTLNHFCLFLQKCVLQIQDGKKLPASVITFVNKLNLNSNTCST